MLRSKARSLPKAWKDTLRLPRSSFQPRGPSPSEHSQLLQQCTDDLYAWQRANQKGEDFVLHDGPPYANGDLHVGHALNKILKDITCRFQLGQGRRIHFRPGWDCHGLPIELKALEQRREQLKKECLAAGHPEIDRGNSPMEIRQLARALAQDTVEKQKAQFKEWAIMADWQNSWTTMDKEFEIKQLGVFKEMVRRGLIYRRFKPVYWSPSTRTALAEAELEYHDDHISTAAFVKFPIVALGDGIRSRLAGRELNISCVVWTTLPWTLPANRAIGYSPGIEYVVVKSHTHGHLLVARSRILELEKQFGEMLEVVLQVNGINLEGTTYKDSSWSSKDQIRQLLPADHVTDDSGSGLAHLAPGHGPDDYKLCFKHNIAPFVPVDETGAFDQTACAREPSLLAGKHVMGEGNQAVLESLASSGVLLSQHKYVHKYPYDWRSKKPVILRATEQWFANVGDIQEAAIKALEKVKFVPSSGKTRLESFIKNRTEWCISRQRAWGVPIPALYHNDTGDALLNGDSVQHIISVIRDRGIDAWWSDDEIDPAWTPPEHRESDGQTLFSRGKDTMDVWFDSGTSWTQTNSNDEVQHSADVYLEGSDQHRGWFQSSLLTHVAHPSSRRDAAASEASFRALVTHGFTLDKHGRKMSKRDGNIVSPQQIMDGSLLPTIRKKINGKMTEFKDAMGPDALRLWVASCDFTKDVTVSPEALKTAASTLVKFRTTFKQLLGILDGWTVSELPEELPVNHTIAIYHVKNMEAKVVSHYMNFEYHKALGEITRYVNVDLSAFYFETIKDAAYCGTIQERHLVQSILAMILASLKKALKPIVPLLVQETLGHIPSDSPDKVPAVSLNSRSQGETPLITLLDSIVTDDKRMMTDEPVLLALLSAVRNVQEQARFEKKMGSSLQSFVTIEVPHIDTNERSQLVSLLSSYSSDLATVFVVSQVDIRQGIMKPMDVDWHYSKDLEILGEKVIVHVYVPQKQKCARCWRYMAPLEAPQEEALCTRCEDVVFEQSARCCC